MGRRAKTVEEKTLDFLKSLGADTSTIQGPLENVRSYKDLDAVQEKIYWQANSNVTFLKKWSRVAVFKNCDQCGRTFATNYRGVAYCSIACCAKTFSEQTKMPWEYIKVAFSKTLEERWKEYEPPMVVSPEFLNTLEYIYLKVQEAKKDLSLYQEENDLPFQENLFPQSEKEVLSGLLEEDFGSLF